MQYLLSIGGYDPTAGAGVIRDILTFRKLGFYGLGIATAITYQNTKGFYGYQTLEPETVEKEIERLVEDFPIKYVKIGMVGNATKIILKFQKRYSWIVVMDPLLHAKNLFKLNEVKNIEELLREAYVITPNIPEAEILSGVTINREDDIIKAGKYLLKKYGKYVIIKGGHGNGVDYLFGDNVKTFSLTHLGKNVHGTGCAYSSALTALLAKGMKIEDAFKEARRFIQGEIEKSIETGGYSLLP
jgi:hydroxymethylpyrimidine/phosphomethylpyrimidine kinase